MSIFNNPGSYTEATPIIVGASGGSGTRVVAEILLQLGIFLGSDLNQSFDNLLFTYFFKRPLRYIRDMDCHKIDWGVLLSLHEKLFLGRAFPTIPEMKLIFSAGRDHLRGPYYGKRWILERWKKMLFVRKPVSLIKEWGWKEPHTMFFLPQLKAHYPNAKFILVLRDGFDMVFSRNTQQFKYWAAAFDLDSNNISENNKFEFWYRSNREAIRYGNLHMGEDFTSIKFEELCINPKPSIDNLIQFLRLNKQAVQPSVWSLPVLPASYGRYRRFNTGWITDEIKQKAAEIGYVH